MNVSPQRFRAPLAGTCALLILLAGDAAFGQHAVAPRAGSAEAMGQLRTAARTTASGQGYRYGAVQRAPLTRGGRYVPPHERRTPGQVVSQSAELIEGEVIYEDSAEEIMMAGPGEIVGPGQMIGTGGPVAGGCDGACGPASGCTSCQRGCIPCPTFSLKSLNATLGVVGFKNAANRGSDGSFGFQEGINWTTRLPCLDVTGINGQIGVRGVQTNLAGSALTPNNRNQLFVTAGLFRRVDWGLQFGAVVDYLREDWYTEMNLSQVRGEISYVFPGPHQIGFRMAQSTNSQMSLSTFNWNGQPVTTMDTWEALDTYRFFYRFRSQMIPAAVGEAFAGLSNESHTLFGANAVVPLGSWVALQSNFTYLIPQDNTPPNGTPGETEVWNIGFGMVIYPGGPQNRTAQRYDAPLFDVGDNGSFITKRVRP